MKIIFQNNFLNKLNKCEIRKLENSFPKISIVMPCYNQVEFIEKSILSVLNQDYKNFELIIIDGGSNDGTIEIIKKYQDYISFWVSEKDKGQSDALNKGFKLASGEIYGWLNSDDIYLPNAFHNLMLAFKNNLNKKIVFGDWLSFDRNLKNINLNYAFDFNLNHFKYEGFHLNAQSMFWRSEVHHHFSGFDVELNNTMDYQMILEFGINEGEDSFLRIPYVIGGFRRYKGQKSSGMTTRVIKEHKSISKKYKYTDKYRLSGKIKRVYFRFRRAIWYVKRGGTLYLIKKLKKSYARGS